MDLARWQDICRLHSSKALHNYPDQPSDESRIQVFGTNVPIGWTKEPLCKTEGIIVGRKGAHRGIHCSLEPFFAIKTAFYLQVTSQEIDHRWAY